MTRRKTRGHQVLFSLRSRLILSFSAIIVLLMGLVAVVCISLVISRFRSLATQSIEQVRISLDKAQSDLETRFNVLTEFVASPDVRRSLREESRSEWMDIIRSNRARLGFDFLAAAGEDGSWSLGQIVFPAGGSEYSVQMDTAQLHISGGEQTQVCLLSQKVGDQDALLVCRVIPVSRWSGGPLSAFMVGGVYLSTLADKIRPRADCELSLQANQRILWSSQTNAGGQGRSGPFIEGLRRAFTLRGETPFSVADVSLGMWEVVVTDESALGMTRELLMRLLLLFFSGTALACAAGFMMARTITRSITQLSKAAKAFAETGRSMAMHSPRDDEVGLLASSFNEMVLQLKENETRLLRAERLAVWREMARRVAHEIKNPLTPIQLSVEGLRRNIPEGVDAGFKARVQDATVTILEEVGRLRRYVDEFSRFARMPKPQLARCDVAEVLFTTARSYTAGVEKVQVTCDVEKREHVALADRQQLATAFSNVIQNALDAMKEGGCLSVSIRTLGKWIEVSIQDSGKGMAPDMVERVFEPYFTTKEAGTGLGMAITLKVVEDHGGRIAIESCEGQGTVVRISLPCAGPEESLGGEVEVKGHGFHSGRG